MALMTRGLPSWYVCSHNHSSVSSPWYKVLKPQGKQPTGEGRGLPGSVWAHSSCCSVLSHLPQTQWHWSYCMEQFLFHPLGLGLAKPTCKLQS